MKWSTLSKNKIQKPMGITSTFHTSILINYDLMIALRTYVNKCLIIYLN